MVKKVRPARPQPFWRAERTLSTWARQKGEIAAGGFLQHSHECVPTPVSCSVFLAWVIEKNLRVESPSPSVRPFLTSRFYSPYLVSVWLLAFSLAEEEIIMPGPGGRHDLLEGICLTLLKKIVLICGTNGTVPPSRIAGVSIRITTCILLDKSATWSYQWPPKRTANLVGIALILNDFYFTWFFLKLSFWVWWLLDLCQSTHSSMLYVRS
jgi:hypothetical protein